MRHVLFLCRGNSCCSQLAQAMGNARVADRRTRGEAVDLVVTVCEQAAEDCPAWLGPGKRVHRGLPDPDSATGTGQEVMAAPQGVHGEIVRRVLPLLRDVEDGGHGMAG